MFVFLRWDKKAHGARLEECAFNTSTRRQMQVDLCKFKASLVQNSEDYIKRLSQKTKQKAKNKRFLWPKKEVQKQTKTVTEKYQHWKDD